MIPESFIQDLLARLSIEDVVGRYVQLRKGGANLLGLCPFHDEKSPSFTVSPSKQFFHCFGCGAHGSAITFVMRHTGASFPEAVRSLAAEQGLAVPTTPRSSQQREFDRRRQAERSQAEQLLSLAQQHYQTQLKAAPQAISYLKRRGLTGQIAARFGLGWSGGGRRALAQVMPHYDDSALVDVGLVIAADDGSRYDRFRERIMFPIRSGRGRLIGFGGRLIAAGEPKYLNSPETALFSKGRELYGLWENRQGIQREGFVLVVEGYMDVVALAQHGLDNAVATLGTATTDVHIRKLIRSSDRLVFCFDADSAGQRAAWRALTNCLPMLRDDVAMRFLFLPDGHDPDSYVNAHGLEAFREQTERADPLSRVLLDTLTKRHATHEAEGRAACVHEARPLFAQMPQGAMRIQIEREFAQLVRLTPDELTAMLAQAPLPGRVNTEAVSQASSKKDSSSEHVERPMALAGAHYKGRSVPSRAGTVGVVTPMARRLLRLLLAHPELIDELGDQQLEILTHRPHLVHVRDLITLANTSGARHVGALLQAVDPDSELATVIASMATEVLLAEGLPDPRAEWNDALCRIELEAIKAEQLSLVQAGLQSEASQKRYQELTRQLALLSPEGLPQVQ